MARKLKKQRRVQTQTAAPRGTYDRDKAIEALMALLAEHPSRRSGWPRSPVAPA